MTEAQIKQMHQQADLLLNNNRLSEARTLYEQICALDSGDAEAYMMRGVLDGEMGRLDDALRSLHQAIRIDPGYADAYHALAHLLHHQGKLAEACDALQRAVDLDPEFIEAWVMLGGVLGQLNDYIKAEVACRSALALDASLVDARLNLANALVEQGKEDEAETELRVIVQHQPANAHAWSLLGALLARLHRSDDSAKALETALSLNPSDGDARTTLGKIFWERKEFSRAAQQFMRIIETNLDRPEIWSSLVRACEEAADSQLLADFCNQLETRYPDNRHVLLNHGYALERLERSDDARECYERLIERFPEWGEGWNRLGQLYMSREEYSTAAPFLKKALDCGVGSPLTLCMYGATRREIGRYKEAERYCRKAVDKAPELPAVYVELGLVQLLMGGLEQALATFNQGLALEPDNLSLLAGVANVLERQGDFEKASETLEPYLESDREGFEQLITIYAKVSNKLKRGERALTLLEKTLSREKVMRASSMEMHFRAGDIYHSKKQHDKAMQHYHKANALKGLEFDRDAHIQYVDDTIRSFDKDTLASLSSLGDPSVRPVFIVGMPRSGTSLVEEILASHPDVYGAGELMEMAVAAHDLGFDYPDASLNAEHLVALGGGTVHKYARAYLESIGGMADGEIRVTDKMPYNFLRLGLVQILFPNARVIHTCRDPMDTCLSCYFLDFMGVHPYAYDLEDLGVYYREYKRLMDHWHNALSLPILDVQYEDLVEDVVAGSRRMIDFCGLEWDDCVLNFHQSGRVVKTASYDQVRRPVYSSSVGRWKAYESWLEPLKRGLSGQQS